MREHISRLAGFVANNIQYTMQEVEEIGNANRWEDISQETRVKIIEAATKTEEGKRRLDIVLTAHN